MSSVVDNNDIDTSKISQQQVQEQEQIPITVEGNDDNDDIDNNNDDSMIANLTLQDITEPMENDISTTTTTSSNNNNNSNNIPKVKFIDNINEYIQSFLPKVITTELLIGAYTQLHTKYKLTETNLLRKQEHLKEKVPELEKSLSLVQSLIEKQNLKINDGIVRYNLTDSIYSKAHIDYTIGIVYLWLGANVMLEYTYTEAIQFLQSNLHRATTELQNVTLDLTFIRDQIVTSEVNISRIYNWDIRQKRNQNTGSIQT